jgi:hypothetical protein
LVIVFNKVKALSESLKLPKSAFNIVASAYELSIRSGG